MARPKGSPDVAPMIRGAFKRAVLALEDKGRPLSTIMMEQLEENPLGTLQALKGFVPKELDVDVTATELTHEQWLAKLEGSDGSDSNSQTPTTTD
jgi:hypothetical protein